MHSGCAEKCLKRHFDHRRVDKKFRQGARASINGWEFKILRSKFFRIFFWWCCPCIPVGGFLCRSLKVLVGGIFVSVHLHVSHVTFFRTGGLIHLNESLQKIKHTEKSLVEVWQISKFSSCNFQLEFWWDMNSTNKYIKIRRGPKLEGCAFANFGNSSGTEGNRVWNVLARPLQKYG